MKVKINLERLKDLVEVLDVISEDAAPAFLDFRGGAAVYAQLRTLSEYFQGKIREAENAREVIDWNPFADGDPETWPDEDQGRACLVRGYDYAEEEFFTALAKFDDKHVCFDLIAPTQEAQLYGDYVIEAWAEMPTHGMDGIRLTKEERENNARGYLTLKAAEKREAKHD